MLTGHRGVLAVATTIMVLAARPDTARAQGESATRDSILATVQSFFSAMEAKDTIRLRDLMLSDGHTLAVVTRNDSTRVSTRSSTEFITRLPQSPQRWRERIWDPQVLIHESLAVVWAPYDFYLDSTFSHCGVDSFTLVRTMNGWRVVDAAFTIEPTGCAPSPLGPRS
jgi:Putative lumazine-binding